MKVRTRWNKAINALSMFMLAPQASTREIRENATLSDINRKPDTRCSAHEPFFIGSIEYCISYKPGGYFMQYYQNPYIAMSPMQNSFMPTQMMPGMNPMPQADPVRGMQDIYTYPYNFQNALDLIREALAGEAEDRQFYEYLIKTAPHEEDKDIIRGIRDNEINHFSMFRQIYFELTGRMPQPTQEAAFTPPATYCEGLRKALMGEQNAVQKYRKILFAMQDRRHINMLTEIITDEIRHGILYSYLYSKNSCKV